MERDVKDLKSDLSAYIKKDLYYFDEVLLYVDQYYQTPEKILKFLKNNPNFDIDHMMGLIQTAPEVQSMKKNEIKNFVSTIED